MLGSLLGSVASGVLGLFGQSSANQANATAAKNQYTWGVADMQRAGLNPAAMYSGGGMSPAPMPQAQNVMGPMSSALKDAASSAVQVKVANATIDKMADEMAKLKAETARTAAETPGIKARSDIEADRTKSIMSIPEIVRAPIYRFGFGGREASSGGTAASVTSGGLAAGSGAIKDANQIIKISPPDFSSAKAAVRRRASEARRFDEQDEERASSARDAWRKWWYGKPRNESVIYKQ